MNGKETLQVLVIVRSACQVGKKETTKITLTYQAATFLAITRSSPTTDPDMALDTELSEPLKEQIS